MSESNDTSGNDGVFSYDHPTSNHNAPNADGSQPQPNPHARPQQKAGGDNANGGDTIIAPPAEIAELRNSPERQLFGDSAAKEIGDVLRDESNLDAGMMHDGVTPEVRRAFFAEVGHMAQDLELSVADVRELIVLSREDHPGIPERFAETVKALTERFGVAGRQEAYTAAYQLIDADPRVRNLLAESLLLDHPKVVVKLAEKALSMRARGTLKAAKK